MDQVPAIAPDRLPPTLCQQLAGPVEVARSTRMHHCAAMENRMWLLQAPAGREAQGLTLLLDLAASVARQRPSLSSWLMASSSWGAQSNHLPLPALVTDLTHSPWEGSIFVRQTPRMS